MHMDNDSLAKPESAAPAVFPWMTTPPDVFAWPLRIQDMLWRESLLAMARIAELRAECLRKLAETSMPMDAAAIQGDYARKLLDVAEDEGSRLARGLKDAAPAAPGGAAKATGSRPTAAHATPV